MRFRAKGLEERFPPVDGSDNWGQQHYWFYELISRTAKDGVGCDLSLQPCFYLPKSAPLSKDRVDASHAYTDAFSGGADGTFHGVWTGYVTYVVYLAPGDFGYESISVQVQARYGGQAQRPQARAGSSGLLFALSVAMIGRARRAARAVWNTDPSPVPLNIEAHVAHPALAQK